LREPVLKTPNTKKCWQSVRSPELKPQSSTKKKKKKRKEEVDSEEMKN
jgi:hypothetical protein